MLLRLLLVLYILLLVFLNLLLFLFYLATHLSPQFLLPFLQ